MQTILSTPLSIRRGAGGEAFFPLERGLGRLSLVILGRTDEGVCPYFVVLSLIENTAPNMASVRHSSPLGRLGGVMGEAGGISDNE